MIDIRLFREENQDWIEKAVITRLWISSSDSISENALEQLHSLFDTVLQNSKAPLSAPATHAAQTVRPRHVLFRKLLLSPACS